MLIVIAIDIKLNEGHQLQIAIKNFFKSYNLPDFFVPSNRTLPLLAVLATLSPILVDESSILTSRILGPPPLLDTCFDGILLLLEVCIDDDDEAADACGREVCPLLLLLLVGDVVRCSICIFNISLLLLLFEDVVPSSLLLLLPFLLPPKDLDSLFRMLCILHCFTFLDIVGRLYCPLESEWVA